MRQERDRGGPPRPDAPGQAASAVEQPVQIDVLGRLRAARPSGPVTLGAGAPRTVLALLAGQPGTWMSVGELQESLGELDPSRSWSRSTVHSAIWRLRRALGGDVLGSDEAAGYRLEPGRCVVDADLFSDRAREGRRYLTSGEEIAALDRFEEALDLWRGEPFSEWAGADSFAAVTERLVEIRHGVLEDRAAALAAAGKSSDAVDVLTDLLDEAPMREHAWALLVESLTRCNRAGEARRAFDRARVVLADAGLEPGAELQAALAALTDVSDVSSGSAAERVLPNARAAAYAATGVDAAAATLPPTPSPRELVLPQPVALLTATPMLGRDELLATLKARVASAPEGIGVTILRGEPGIGKTRLAAEACAAAHEAGAATWFEIAQRGTMQPGGPWADWIRRMLEAMPAEQLEEVFEGPLGRMAGGDGIGVLETDHERWIVARAVAKVVAGACTPWGVLVIDNLEHMPLEGIQLLQYMLVGHPELPLHVVATLGLAAGAGAEPRWWTGLTALPNVTVQELGGLSSAELTELAHTVNPDVPLAGDRADRLRRASGGNPMLARVLVEEGLPLSAEASARPVTGPILEAARHLLANVHPETMPVLHLMATGAMVQPVVDHRLLVRVASHSVSHAALEEGLDSLVALGVLRQSTTGGASLMFEHGVVGHAAYRSMPASDRYEAHAAFATALIASRRGRRPDEVMALAEHVWRAWPAVRVPDGGRWLRQVGMHAANQLTFDVAATWYERALEWLDGDASPEAAREQVELSLLLGRAYVDGGRPEVGRSAFEAAADGAALANWPTGIAAAALGLAETMAGRIRPDAAAVHTIREALLHPEDLDPDMHGEMVGYLMLADPDAALGLERVATRARESVSGPEGVAQMLERCWWSTPLERRAGLVEDLAAVAAQADNADLLAAAELYRWVTAVQDGSAGLQERADHERVERARMASSGMASWLCTLWATGVATAAGDVDEARRQLARARAIRLPYAGVVTAVQPRPAYMRAVHRGLEGLLSAPEGGDAVAEETFGTRYRLGTDVRCTSLYVRARLHLPIDPVEIEVLLAEGIFDRPRHADGLVNAVMAAEGAAAAGHAVAMRVANEGLTPHGHRHVILGVGYYHGPVAEALGALAAGRGDLDEAIALTTAAAEATERIGAGAVTERVAARLVDLRRARGSADDFARVDELMHDAEERLVQLRSRRGDTSAD